MSTKILITLVALFILTAVKINSQPTGPNENNIKFENVTTATLVGQDGLIMRTEDGGNNWATLTTGVTNNLKSNDFFEFTKGEVTVRTHLAVGENGVILKSVDNGSTWEIKTSNTIENLNDVAIYSPTMVYACGNNGTLLYSEDMGDTWLTIATETTENLNHIAYINDIAINVIQVKMIMTGSNGTVLLSHDYGTTWVPGTSGVTEQLNAAFSLGNNYFYAVGNNGTLIKSDDGGYTWSVLTTTMIDNINDIKFLGDFSTGIASCDNGAILRTTDAGLTWEVVTTPSTSDLFAVNFSGTDLGITVGENGTELYSVDGGATWISKETDKLASVINNDIKLLQNYPNPFNPSTMINYELPFNASVSVKIYDMLGKEVRTLVNGYQNSGTYSVSFNASNLSSGIYFYVLRASTGNGEMTKTMRMILTK